LQNFFEPFGANRVKIAAILGLKNVRRSPAQHCPIKIVNYGWKLEFLKWIEIVWDFKVVFKTRFKRADGNYHPLGSRGTWILKHALLAKRLSS